MNNIDEVIQVISIGIPVATFLLYTCRVNKAMKVFKECIFLMESKLGVKYEKSFKPFYKLLVQTFCFVRDYTSAIRYVRKLLHVYCECGERHEECWLSIKLANLYCIQGKLVKAGEIYEKALVISKEIDDSNAKASCYGNLGNVYQSLGKYDKARESYEKALTISKEGNDKCREAPCHSNLASVFRLVGEYHKAIEHNEEALAICKEIGYRNLEAWCYRDLGIDHGSLGNFVKAREYLEKGLTINKEICDRNGEASFWENLGIVSRLAGEYEKAIEYHEKALAIRKEIGARTGEESSYVHLGTLFYLLCKYLNAKECFLKALAIDKEIGERNGEACCYGNLGTVFCSLGDYVKAKEYLKKALRICKDIGDRNTEASFRADLGIVSQSVGEYQKARVYYEQALAVKRDTGDRHGEASCYGYLGTLFQALGEYEKANEYLHKALTIEKETGNRNGEAACYGNLGAVFQSIGDYEKAREYHQEAMEKQQKIGDKNGEGASLGNLALVFESVGESEKAREYYEKALVIKKQIGDRYGEAVCCENLGTLFQSLGKYACADEYLQRALMIRKDIGDRRGEASSYGNLGGLFLYLGDIDKAKDYHEKALAIRKDICDRKGEAQDYLALGDVFKCLRECDKAEEYDKVGLTISREIGDVEKQFNLLCKLAWIKLLHEKMQEALSYLLLAVQKCEDLRGFLRDNDHFKISFTDKNAFSYWLLSALFCDAGNPNEALYVSELGRARALTELMSVQYSVKNQISANPQTWVGLERIMDKEFNSTCLYVSYSWDNVFLWILRANGVVHLRNNRQEDRMNFQSGIVRNLDELFVNESFRFCILPEEHCEDRSLDSFHCKSNSLEEQSCEAARIEKDDKDSLGPKVNLSECYELIIAPVVDLLDGPEIIIVPDRSIYNIPFAALPDESGKYLSETFRIRVVPSLTTLKLIHESPADYHSQTGALIVGNPDVGKVHLRGRLTNISRLRCAENEAKMVAEKLGVEPLLGQKATKQAVLEVINSVSLIHFAAHGDAERGEIALAPTLRIPNRIPQEKDYLLTMSDISKVQLRAKLVVLSCCHSARGRIRAEGVVGIARAFLGSGARSVLVALWALSDSATEQFMSRFYEHLVRGESASESLHEAMKWMRCNGYSDVRQWAPFMLIGDNVSFGFRK